MGKLKNHYFFADCPHKEPPGEWAALLRENGFSCFFDAGIYPGGGMFFLERALGAQMRYVDDLRDTFHAYCEPLVESPSQLGAHFAHWEQSPAWLEYFGRVCAYASEAGGHLPLVAPHFYPLDAACALMGALRFFELLADDREGALYMLECVTELYLGMVRAIRKTGLALVNPFGFPGGAAGDLNAINISPALLYELVYPLYARAAAELGGLFLGISPFDEDTMRNAAAAPGFTGLSFDARIPFETIDRLLGGRMFVMHNYVFLDEHGPAECVGGIYVNPIVASHSRDIEGAWRALSGHHDMCLYIQRHTFEEIKSTKERLMNNTI